LTGLRPLTDRAALLAALPDDRLLRQLAAHWVADQPAYALGGAVALFHAFDSEPDLVVVGDPGDAADLVSAYDVKQLSVPKAAEPRVAAEHGMTPLEGWGFRWTGVAPPVPDVDAGWLPPSADGEVAALLGAAFPDASMPVGHPGVRRWAGLRRDGRLVACVADATAVPELGFLASIATHPDVRGTGAGTAVTAWATAALVREHGECGLWHMAGNAAAIAVYDRLGYHDEPMGYLVRK
jgi:ribosomal protein S18 acetylase RimI-like enzyme